jgi:hypothetical protein
MTTDNRLDYLISRVDEACDRLSRLEQQVTDHREQHAQKSVFGRWLLPVVISLLTLTASASTFAIGYHNSGRVTSADHIR